MAKSSLSSAQRTTAARASNQPALLPFLGAVAVMVIVICGVYGRALDAPFVFDDPSSIAENASITSLWPLWGSAEHPAPLSPPKDIPTSGRPLVNLSLALNYHFGGLNPVGYHALNLLVHLLSALLLMAIVWRTLRLEYFAGRFDRFAQWLALAVALLWAVHPLQTETVVYVTQRTELFVGFFYLTTLYGSLRYWAATSVGSRTVWLAVSIASCLCGMACKEVMVTAPVVVLLFERTFIAGSFRKALGDSWPLYLGLALTWSLLAVLNVSAPRSHSAGFNLEVPVTQWWLIQAKVLWMYLKLVVWPWPLSIHYDLPFFSSPAAAWPWLLATFLLAIGALVLFWRRTAIGFVGAWVFLILLPTLVVPVVTEVAAERRMYLPLAALVALLVIGGYSLLQSAHRPVAAAGARPSTLGLPTAVLVAITLIIVVGLSFLSVRRLDAYQNEITLWQDVLASQPNDALAHNNLGALLDRSGRPQEAIEQCEEALRLKPQYPAVYNNLGSALIDTGKASDAIELLQRAIRMKLDNPETHYNLGNALVKSNQQQAAITEYEIALTRNPLYGEAHGNLASVLANEGKISESIEHYQEAIRLRPAFAAELHLNLGRALAKAGRMPDAIEQFREVVRLRPNNPAGYADLTKAFAQAHQSDEAIRTAQQALNLARSQGQTEIANQIETWLAVYRSQQTNSVNPATSGGAQSAP